MLNTDDVVADRYRLVSRIAEGGMGTVWEAWDERLHRTVALKRLRPPPGLSSADSEQVRQRAMREARITARLHHAHAVQVYDVTDADGQPCLVMQYLPSRSLADLIREHGALPPDEVARIGAEIASALAAAHRAGIVHRDVKPGNVLIDENDSAKITDFGIAHALGDVTLTSAGMVTGTPAFLAPEVARGARSTPASDVFSLGATLYHALEGQPPFGTDENPMATLHRVASGRIRPPRRSGRFTPLLERMLHADPVARPHMETVTRNLQALLPDLRRDRAAGAIRTAAPGEATAAHPDRRVAQPSSRTLALPPVSRRPATPPPPQPPPLGPAQRPRRRRWPVALAAVAALLLGGVIAAVAMTLGNGPSAPQAQGRHVTHRPSTGAARGTQRSHRRARHATATRANRERASHVPASHATAPPSQSTPAAPGGGPPTAAQLASAIINYYRLLPGDTSAAWPLLTPSYQQEKTGDEANYDSFWNQFRSVTASDVVATPPQTVVATITYTRTDGSVTQERTSFGLVRQDGQLKINSSYVISSG